METPRQQILKDSQVEETGQVEMAEVPAQNSMADNPNEREESEKEGEYLEEGEHEMADFPFREYDVTPFSEKICCTRRLIQLSQTDLIYVKKGICGEEKKKKTWNDLGAVTSKSACCNFQLKVEGMFRLDGDANPCNANDCCCVSAGTLKKMEEDISSRRENLGKGAGGGGGSQNIVVNVQAAAPPPQQQPMMMMQQQPMMMMQQQPMMMQQQPMMMQQQPMMMQQQPMMMQQQPMMMQQQPMMMAPAGAQQVYVQSG